MKVIIASLAALTFAACAATDTSSETKNTQLPDKLEAGSVTTLKGLYTWGHEVEAFEPCGSDVRYWAQGEADVLGPLQKASLEKAIKRQRPYLPILIEALVEAQQPAAEGFAESYDGVVEILKVTQMSSEEDACHRH